MLQINVLYPFDNTYAPYGGISLTSLLENNKAADAVHVYVLGFDLGEDTKEKLQKTVDRYGRDLTLLDPSGVEAKIKSLKLPSYRGASVAVARLFVSEFIPNDVDRLLYLDSDTIITGDLRGLFNADLNGKPVGMVCDSVPRDYKKCMGFAPEEDYYNGGMILYDMPAWREKKCTERIIDHVENVRSRYEALDQDLINIVLKGEIERLDLRYNFQPFHRVYPAKAYLKAYGEKGYYDGDTIREASEHAAILHAFRYLGVFPWHKGTLHPYASEYEHYKQLSLWSDMAPEEPPKKGFMLSVECILYRLFPGSLFLRSFRLAFGTQMARIEKQLKKNAAYYENI